jgi:hypothetical protein
MTKSNLSSSRRSSSRLRVGDWVEVRSKEEILRTLDSDGCLDGMPFMPEMFAFCGEKFQVYKRAHKTCDTVFPVRGRKLDRAVHLETRCNGSSHGGCQASCLLFWKDAWLRPINGNSPDLVIRPHTNSGRDDAPGEKLSCSEFTVFAKTQTNDSTGTDPVYACQATKLPYATTSLEWWDIRQYVEDYTSGNVGLWRILCGVVYFPYLALSRARFGLGRLLRWFYDKFHFLWRGFPFPRRHGLIPEGEPTPTGTLGVQPGDLVRIKPYKEILKTLNTRNRNRGLYFDAEEVPYCGGTYRVLKQVTRIVNERTGKMQEMKTPSFILDSVICQSRYSECRLFCPRSIYSYWREIWIERVQPETSDASGAN